MDRATMLAIRAMDPDGWETRQPTDADRQAFRRLVADRFGATALHRYYQNWDS